MTARHCRVREYICRCLWYDSPWLSIFLVKNFRRFGRPKLVLNKILRLCEKSRMFQVFYDHRSAHRTSNMVDRLMDRQDRFLYIMKYFHGHFISAERGIRAWAILMNFGPYCPRATDKKGDWVCAAQKLNGFRYSDDWLENLLISSSMNGYRR